MLFHTFCIMYKLLLTVFTVTKMSCSPQCDGRCFGPLPNQCCHRECAAGCTGRTKSTCWVCKMQDLITAQVMALLT